MDFQTGKTYSGFTLTRHEYIEEIHADVFLFEHGLLGCPLLAIKNSDNNKTFAVAFNTIPVDSTGVAHILEHSVLMGSKKYPVKDVFGEINKGGLLTFLNAMTGADITYYPFATRNLKEYFNIMDVYCDVVFNPLLHRTTFEQEGWHYHQEDLAGPLSYQGVVYNEMKGAFSDPIRLIFHHIFGGLMPGSTYAHESGGDPASIPDLSYEQFCQFHRQHYHPSNATFLLYGDAPLADELRYLQDNFLAAYQARGERSAIVEGSQPDQPVFVTDRYAVDSQDTREKTFLAVGTHVTDLLDRQLNCAFQVIANILFNSDGSPLKNAIVSSGMCKDFGGLYLASSSFKTFMITYLVGSEAHHRQAFVDLYTRVLTDMVANGLDHDLVLAEMNKYEFSLREEASKAQRGLDLTGKAMMAIKYGTDPYSSLVNDAMIRELRRKALKEGYFEELIQQFLLDNQATVTVTLEPDPDKQAAGQRDEEQRLQRHAATLSEDDRDELVARTRNLLEMQQQPNDVASLALLPQLKRSDLTDNIAFHTASPSEMFGKTVLVNELATNHITYLDIGFDVRGLPVELLPLIDIFGTIVTEIGTERLDYRQFAKEVATCTGSFSHSLTTHTRRGEKDSLRPVFWLSLKCLPNYLERALQMVTEVLTTLSLTDRNRIREIVGREFAWAEHAVQSEGYSLAASRVFAGLSQAGQYNELFSGVTPYLALKRLALDYPAGEQQFLKALERIAATLFNRRNLIFSITTEERELQQFARIGGRLTEALADAPLTPQPLPPRNLVRSEAFITSAEVTFNVMGASLLPEAQGYNGHFEVLKTYLSRDYLWNTVRQMGGAYGCFVQFSPITGNIAFVSYRDPQVKKTYEAYEKIPEVVASLRLADEVLEQLTVGTYGNFDPHQSPAAKGVTARNEYLSGIDVAYKQQRLDEILHTTTDDLRSFAPAFTDMLDGSCRATIGNRKKIETDRNLFDQLTEI
ncbi:MAG: insulinase family protein [Desulfopila sp.]